MSDTIDYSELDSDELNSYEDILYEEILDLKYIEDTIHRIESDLNNLTRTAQKVFLEVPDELPSADTREMYRVIRKRRERREKQHREVEEELAARMEQ